MRPMTRSRWDPFLGKAAGILALAGLGTALMHGADDMDAPWWGLLIVLAAVGGVAAATYEGVGWGLGRIIAAARRSWRRRFRRHGTSDAGGHGYRPSRAIGTLLAYIAAMFGTWLGAAIILMIVDPAQALDLMGSPHAPVILAVSMLVGAAAAAAVFVRSASPHDRAIALGWLRTGGPAAVAAVAAAGLVAAWVFVILAPRWVDAGGATPSSLWEMQSGAAPGSQAIILVAVIAVAPVVEEILFRGVLLDGFLRRWGHFTAVLTVTLLFVLVHVPDVLSYWPMAVMIGAIGAGAAYLRLRFDAIGPAIALHAGYNLGVASVWLGMGG